MPSHTLLDTLLLPVDSAWSLIWLPWEGSESLPFFVLCCVINGHQYILSLKRLLASAQGEHDIEIVFVCLFVKAMDMIIFHSSNIHPG